MTTTPTPESDRIEQRLIEISNQLAELKQNQERFDTCFSNHQKATQWVVQLAFTLITFATITIILTAVLR